uniref:Fibronectin type-III domain-containing protein n=1 Tax=Eptatretus burgeri TaxID=7764 RepID=A0A8C4QKS7_EPTBU
MSRIIVKLLMCCAIGVVSDNKWPAIVEPPEIQIVPGMSAINDPLEVQAVPDSSVTVRCILSTELHNKAKDVIWFLGKEKVPENQYNVTNSSVAEVHLINLQPTETSMLGSHLLSCCLPGINGSPYQLLAVTNVIVSYPPCAPFNITCYTMDILYMNCSWILSECVEPQKTIFHLRYDVSTHPCDNVYKNMPMGHSAVKSSLCDVQGDQGWCRINTLRWSAGRYYRLWVEGSNAIGVNNSSISCHSLWNIVKPNPPSKVNLSLSGSLAPHLQIHWLYPEGGLASSFFPLVYEIHYNRNSFDPEPQVFFMENTSRELDMAVSCTNPSARVRAQSVKGYGYWSDWSPLAMLKIAQLQAPQRGPDIWRDIRKTSEGSYSLKLFWKMLSKHEAQCFVQTYTVVIQMQDLPRSVQDVGNTTTFQIDINNNSCCVEVWANNFIGTSQNNTRLCIPAVGQFGKPPCDVKVERANHKGLWVTWKPPSEMTPLRYVVEWRKGHELDTGPAQWMRVHNSNKSDIHRIYLTGEFVDYVRYKVSVYATFPGGEGEPSSEYVYIRQGVPQVAPRNVRIQNSSWEGFDLRWDVLPISLRKGFILGYRIFYWPSNKPPSSVQNVTLYGGELVQSYRLLGLEPDVEYVVRILAFTEAGDGPQSNLKKAITSLNTGMNVVIWVSVISGTLLLVLTCTIMLVVYRQPAICVVLYSQQVPDPKNCSWAKDMDFTKPDTLHEALKVVSMLPEPWLLQLELQEVSQITEHKLDESEKDASACRVFLNASDPSGMEEAGKLDISSYWSTSPA